MNATIWLYRYCCPKAVAYRLSGTPMETRLLCLRTRLVLAWNSRLAASFKSALNSSPIPDVPKSLEPLIAVPEYRTWLPPGGHASQSDLFVLAKSSTGLVVVIVEGKVKESFGERISDMAPRMSAGQRERLEHLCKALDLHYSTIIGSTLRYQLFHRTASAIVEAERFGAKAAMMVVQSFDQQDAGLVDFDAFASKLGCRAAPGVVERASSITSCELYLGWIRGC